MLSNHLTFFQKNFKLFLYTIGFLFFIVSCAHNETSNLDSHFDDKKEEFQSCYKIEDKSKQKLKRNIIFDFTIDRVGKVKKSKIQNSYWMKDEFRKCLLSILDDMTFTPSESGRDKKNIYLINYYESAN